MNTSVLSFLLGAHLLPRCAVFVILGVLGCAAAAHADDPSPTGNPYDIDWNTIDGGGDMSSNGPLVLEGTIGQHDAGVEMQGAGFSLVGGYWPLDGADLCLADINQDGTLDFFDYLDFVAAFSEQLPPADFNYDGNIDFFDYLDFVAAFSNGC
ncbi:MAG: hypothetical protein KGS45_13245 [Planctomycetes bacterium]|nr:hypothetical protein [Planctomycetota bacterium]